MNPSHKPSPPPLPSIDLQIDEAYQKAAPTSHAACSGAGDPRAEHVDDAEVSIVVTGDELLHQLNLEYRGIDAPTDVLSFSAQEELGESETAFVTAPEAEAYLGDVIISYPMAARQAEAAGPLRGQ